MKRNETRRFCLNPCCSSTDFDLNDDDDDDDATRVCDDANDAKGNATWKRDAILAVGDDARSICRG